MTPQELDNQEKEARRLILRKAAERFLRTGFRRFVMDDLARDTGMSKKTLYRYFPGKTELIKAVWTDIISQLNAEQLTILNEDGLRFPEKLQALLAPVSQLFRRFDPRMINDLIHDSPQIWQWMNSQRMVLIHNIKSLIIQGQKEGLVRTDIDADFQTAFLEAIVSSLLTPVKSVDLNLGPQQMLDNAFGLFLEGTLNTTGRTHRSRKENHR